MSLRRAVVLVLGAGALFLAVGAHPAAAATWTVDDDHGQCPDAQFSSIQAAVDAASAGDTIQVCPGLYQESVTVDKPLSLVGPGVGADPGTMSYCSQASRSDPLTQAIIRGMTGGGGSHVVDLAAESDSLSGFVVESGTLTAALGVATEGVGGASGYQIDGNVIQNTGNNVFLQTSGANETDVRDNCLRTNPLEHVGSPSQNGVVFNGSHNARIDGNAFYRNSGAAVDFRRSSAPDVVISHNDSLLDGRFAVANDTQGGAIVGNNVSSTLRDGIELHSLNTSLVVGANTLAQGRGGIVVTAPGNVYDAIVDNRISDMRISGIVVQLVGSLQYSLVGRNTITNSAHNGIELHASATNNQISDNSALGSGLFDCYDDSVGTGTAGTANTWTNDVGQTENRPGLCH